MSKIGNLNRWQIWLLAARPKTLPAGAVPVMIGGVLAMERGLVHWPAFFAALVGSLLIQIATNFTNDLFDFLKNVDDGDRLGPLRVTQAGLVSPTAMKRAIGVVIALTLLVGSYLVYRGGAPVLIIGIVSIICGVLYTAGPWPLGYHGLGDLFVLIFYGPVAVCGTYYVITLDFTITVLLAGIAPGMISTAILVVNNLRDLDGDRRTGKGTLAVRLGRRFARTEYLLLVMGGSLLPLVLMLRDGNHPWGWLPVLTLIPALPVLKTVLTSTYAPALNSALAYTGKLLVIWGVLFCMGWLL
jgi:1,4-dihydroxy-2-naphthoate polyprenyltransferase